MNDPNTILSSIGDTLNGVPSLPPTVKPPAISTRQSQVESGGARNASWRRRRSRTIIGVSIAAILLLVTAFSVAIFPKRMEIARSSASHSSQQSEKVETAVDTQATSTATEPVNSELASQESTHEEAASDTAANIDVNQVSNSPITDNPAPKEPESQTTGDRPAPPEIVVHATDSEPAAAQPAPAKDALKTSVTSDALPENTREGSTGKIEKSAYPITATLDLNKLEHLGEYVVVVKMEIPLQESWRVTICEQDGQKPIGSPRKLADLGDLQNVKPVLSMSARFDSDPEILTIRFRSAEDQPAASRLRNAYRNLIQECGNWQKLVQEIAKFFVKPLDTKEHKLPDQISLSPIDVDNDADDFFQRCKSIGEGIELNSSGLERIKLSANDSQFFRPEYRQIYQKAYSIRQTRFDEIKKLYDEVVKMIESISTPREFYFTGVIILTRDSGEEEVLPLKFECSAQP